MAKYLKLFSTNSEYETYMSGSPFLPNVSLCTDQNAVHFTPASAPQPIAEVFNDDTCTTPYDGEHEIAYVRFNRNFDEECVWQDTLGRQSLQINTPTSEYPDDPYAINYYFDAWSDDFSEPFTAGQVVELSYPQGGFVPITNPQTVFYAEDAQ